MLGLGVAGGDVFMMRNRSGSALELEDFVIEERLLQAAARIVAKWHAGGGIGALEAGGGTRMSKLERAFERQAGVALPKVDLAYELLGFLDADPRTRLLDPRRIDAFREVATAVVARLGVF